MNISEENERYTVADKLNGNVFNEPISPNCSKILQEKEHVLIGISPFNSYYSEQRISGLIQWASANFKSFHLFIPDTLPYFNFLAMGYSPDKAKHKTTRQWYYLRNKITRAFIHNGFLNQYISKIVTIGEALSGNEVYKRLREECWSKYENDSVFRNKCLNASQVIISKYGIIADNSAKLKIVANYFLGELPLYLDTPKIMG